jgi:transposase
VYEVFLVCSASRVDSLLPVEERVCIGKMHQGGAKGVEIVAALGHPKSTVCTILKELERHGSIEHPKLTERLRKLSDKSVRVITHELVQDQRQTLVDITNRSGFNVSVFTIRKAFHDVGSYKRVA